MKFSTKKIGTLTLMLGLFISSCIMHYYNSNLQIRNHSKEKITILHSNSATPSTPNNVDYYIADWVYIEADSINSITIRGKSDAWHEYIEQGKDKHLYLFVFSVDTLKRYHGLYTMDQLLAMGKYLKVLKYSEPELIKMNWRVDYKDNKITPSSK